MPLQAKASLIKIDDDVPQRLLMSATTSKPADWMDQKVIKTVSSTS
jgi:hypothetical protein